MTLVISPEIRSLCPQLIVGYVTAKIAGSEYCPELWEEIRAFQQEYRSIYTTESLKQHPAVSATREAYRRCGKEPSRYRPSSEALIRRMLQGKDLYRINTAVDLINLASIRFGYSIGGFDADKISGDEVVLGIGRHDEPYEGIGRGPLNIEHMPVWRDSAGGIGTPTSDNERTKLSLDTVSLLAIVNGYDGNEEAVMACAGFIRDLAVKYLEAVSVAVGSVR